MGVIPVVDVFAGPGGWDVACARLGVAVVGIEWDRDACRTRAAAGHLTIRADVSAYPPEPFAGATGLIASPPCPSFSMAGKRDGIRDIPRILEHVRSCGDGWVDVSREGWKDDRSRLVLEVVRWASALRPRWIACEQVPPVLPVWEEIARLLRGWGYSAWCGLLSAETFGVPQTRERAILMARRDGKVASPPVPTHQEYRPGEPRWEGPRTDLFGHARQPWVSMADGLGWGMTDRPAMTFASGCCGGNKHQGGPDLVGGSGARAAVIAEREAGRWQLHTNRDQRPDGERQTCDPSERPASAFTAKSGGQWVVSHDRRWKPGWSGSPTYDPTTRPARVVRGVRPISLRIDARSNATSRPASAPAPAPALLASMDNGDCRWVHERPATSVCGDPRLFGPGVDLTKHAQDRAGTLRITVEEAATLQSFPDGYPWRGTRTARFRQIGDAFCPLVAEAILRELTA